MRRQLFLSLIGLFVLIYALSPVSAQECVPPALSVSAKASNIFSPEQESVLGEMTYQKLSGDLRFVNDPELVAYINRIGERLIRHLPATGLKIQIFIIDIPEANAFDVPGGYIFVSRKLIGFAKSEDELAAVLAHEMGHAVVRHGAIDFTQRLKKVLNVTQVGDRKDISDKFNLLIERRRTKESSHSEEQSEQLEADRIGLFAAIAAGYDPNAFAEFFGRLVETKAKGGNWFSDFFSKPKPEEKRLREMIKLSDQMPAKCREIHAANDVPEFLKWQAEVVSYRDKNKKEELPGLLWKRELAPKLRSDISHFAFSPDGKYFLAQDDFAITVIKRDPLGVAFQITAPAADDANFTPDGQFVVFGTDNLRFEKWSVAEQKPVQLRELVVRRDCWQHQFSPDGNYLVCFDYGLNLNIFDTQNARKVFEKKEFYRLTFYELLSWVLVGARGADSDRNKFFNIEFSPDAHLVAVARTNRFRFSFRFNGLIADESDDTVLALDLGTMKPIRTGVDFKRATRRPFLFLDSNRIIGMPSNSNQDSGIFSFPEGKRLARFQFGALELKRTQNPSYVIVKPVSNATMGVFDIDKSLLVTGANKVDADMWGSLMVYESVSGKVLVSEAKYDEATKLLQAKSLGTVDIPVAAIGQLYAANLSDNLEWLAVSTRTRGAVWNLTSGERKLFVRGFRGSVVANDGSAVGEFPKQEPVNHSLALLNPNTGVVQVIRDLPEFGAKQYGRLLLIRRSLKEPKKSNSEKDKKDAEKEKNGPPSDAEPTGSLQRNVHFELKDILTDKIVWSRDFPKESPGFFFDAYSGRLIFYWTLGSDVGKARLGEDSTIAARAKQLGNKEDDYLLEVIDAFAGRTLGTVLIETGKGSFDIKTGASEKNWLVLTDSQNRVLVYSISDGTLIHRFFGSEAAINPARNLIIVQNLPGELTCYELTNGDSQARLIFGTSAAFARFSSDGKRLFVLSGDQTAYTFDVDKLLARTTVPQ